MMVYLTAHRVQRTLGFGELANLSIFMFGIDLPDKPTTGTIGPTGDVFSNGRSHGLFPFEGYKNAIRQSTAAFLSSDEYCQNINNFYDRWSFDYAELFPRIRDQDQFGREDHLIFNIRGRDKLSGFYSNYTSLPSKFHQFLIQLTGLEPVFFGQLTESASLRTDARFYYRRILGGPTSLRCRSGLLHA